ncbi:hypothetical protein DSECCO2_593260 [anaerobic digester metagenome]
MNVSTQQFLFSLIPQQGKTADIAKGAQSLLVDAENTFGCGVEDQAQTLPAFFKFPLFLLLDHGGMETCEEQFDLVAVLFSIP